MLSLCLTGFSRGTVFCPPHSASFERTQRWSRNQLLMCRTVEAHCRRSFVPCWKNKGLAFSTHCSLNSNSSWYFVAYEFLYLFWVLPELFHFVCDILHYNISDKDRKTKGRRRHLLRRSFHREWLSCHKVGKGMTWIHPGAYVDWILSFVQKFYYVAANTIVKWTPLIYLFSFFLSFFGPPFSPALLLCLWFLMQNQL